MSVFFELPIHLRQRWWNANTWQEREAVEEEFHKMKENAAAELHKDETHKQDAVSNANGADLYREALQVIGIPSCPKLEEKLCGPDPDQTSDRLRTYLAAFKAERQAWKVFAAGAHHSVLEVAQELKRKTLAELDAAIDA